MIQQEAGAGDLEEEVNPARAGMIRARTSATGGPRSKPRASGDDPCLRPAVGQGDE